MMYKKSFKKKKLTLYSKKNYIRGWSVETWFLLLCIFILQHFNLLLESNEQVNSEEVRAEISEAKTTIWVIYLYIYF